ncbi:MAG: thioredoxin family protein [Salinivirgaceae bacterium]|nr:thioredoxin family protein [Salinivirgaceae bacterium]
MNILKQTLTTIFAFCTIAVEAQIQNPVKWDISSQKLAENEYQIVFKAKIDAGWHIFSQYLPKGNYSLPTSFIFDNIVDAELVDTVREMSKVVVEKDEYAGVMVRYYCNEAVFIQSVKSKGSAPVISGRVECQACSDEQCVMNEQDFRLSLVESSEVTPAGHSEVIDNQSQTTISEASDNAVIRTTNSKSLWKVILEAILWGFAALLTPCVFPMVPMTVSFFLKNEQNKGRSRSMASAFGLSIVALYTIPIAIIIIATYLIGGQSVTADIFNWLSTHWLPNVLFFIIFMVFAASFLGAFEIVLPSSLINKADSKSNNGGLVGVLFMALTLVLVSFSCTGPIVGTILVKSTQGDIWEPIITMLAFSVAFALPFTLLAFFPSWLTKLPKSGSWLNTVKVTLGFIEIALGLKFLSVADQTYHWGILDREVYLAIWIADFALLALFLLGKLQIGETKNDPPKVFRLLLGLLISAFTIYLIPGMWGAPLKALSGYLPPQTTIDFDLSAKAAAAADDYESALCETPKYADLLHLPHGLQGYFDYNQALECAKEQDKPLFIDFTGHGCVNCREMEARVWSDAEVLDRLRNEYVVVALYVDDKTTLPESEWVTSEYDGKVKKSIGKVNADFQISRFKINAQPYYCLLDTDGNLLVPPMGYNLNVSEFVGFLDEGLSKFYK